MRLMLYISWLANIKLITGSGFRIIVADTSAERNNGSNVNQPLIANMNITFFFLVYIVSFKFILLFFSCQKKKIIII